MTETRFTDTAPVQGTRVTSDGYLIAEVRCARTGCQVYHASELGLDVSDSEFVTVYRPESAVFAKDSLATYAGKPVTRGHPPEPVTSDNWREYAVGDVGDEIARDGEFVRVPMRLMDQSVIDAIRSGEREISMGYTTPVSMEDGVAPDGQAYQAVQTGPIRINHLAVVPAARGGSQLRIGDDASTWGAAPQPTQKEDAMPDTPLRTIVVDGLSIQVTDQGAQAIEKLSGQIADRTATIATRDATIADLGSQIQTKDGEISALRQQLADATSPAAISAAVRTRSELLDAAMKKGKKKREDYEEMDDAAIRRSVVIDALGQSWADRSDEQIIGAFGALADTVQTNDTSLRVKNQQMTDSWDRFLAKKEAH